MDKKHRPRLGFEMLYLLSACDGDVSESEVEVIRKFLSETYEDISFVPAEVAKNLGFLTDRGILEQFKYAAEEFKKLSGVQERIYFLKFAIEMVNADEIVKEKEEHFLEFLANCWNIDLPRLLDDKPKFRGFQ